MLWLEDCVRYFLHYHFVGVIRSVGPGVTEMVNAEMDKDEAVYKNIRQKEIDSMKAAIAMEKESQVERYIHFIFNA